MPQKSSLIGHKGKGPSRGLSSSRVGRSGQSSTRKLLARATAESRAGMERRDMRRGRRQSAMRTRTSVASSGAGCASRPSSLHICSMVVFSCSTSPRHAGRNPAHESAQCRCLPVQSVRAVAPLGGHPGPVRPDTAGPDCGVNRSTQCLGEDARSASQNPVIREVAHSVVWRWRRQKGRYAFPGTQGSAPVQFALRSGYSARCAT